MLNFFFVRNQGYTFSKKSRHSYENPVPLIHAGVYLNSVTV